MKPVIIVLGDVVEGFTFFGPFPSVGSAERWAATEKGCRDEPWCVSFIHTPAPDAVMADLLSDCRTAITERWDPRKAAALAVVDRIDEILSEITEDDEITEGFGA